VISNILSSAASFAGKLVARPENSAAPLGNELNPAGISFSDAPLRLGKTESLSSTQPSSFSNIIERAVQEVDGTMKAAAADQTKVLTGETNNLHQAMISMQEAGVAFSLMVEVRNKLVDSYQELMRMQV
jgi:flagellar hook-basal body complex protein FliE